MVDEAATTLDATPAADDLVVLADQSALDLTTLSRQELIALQWRQEQAFARQILAEAKGTQARADAVCQAYETVSKIYALAWLPPGGPLVMGYHARQGQLALKLLRRQQRRGQTVRFFEIGYGAGALLKLVHDAGFLVAGIEVSPTLRRHAAQLLGPGHEAGLHVGDFLRYEFPGSQLPISLAYWNDVLEHAPPDEVPDYLRRIHDLLMPGGQLITITPNWHVRPSDITRAFRPPRTDSAGLHLREYTLREVTALLHDAGFSSVATPLLVTPWQVMLCGRGCAGLKRLFEPSLEALPFRLAKLLCRGLGLSMTIATKGF